MGLVGMTHTLHFRITAVFLVLLALVFFGYTWWVDNVLYSYDWAPGEESWFAEEREAELDSLALDLATRLGDADELETALATYRHGIEGYDTDLACAVADGRIVATSDPDSLSSILMSVNPVLLDSMSRDEWHFGRYPNPDYMDAFVNRIDAVIPIHADGDTLTPADGWLVSSFAPLAVETDASDEDNRFRMLSGAGIILLYSLLVGLVLLTWVSRRVRTLSRDMTVFGEGDFDHRTRAAGTDEIGQLSGEFNRLADRLTAVIGELKQSEEYRSQLVANISHDLRTPTATLRSYMESFLLRWQDLETDERDRQLGTITSNLDNLEGLIERLFELTQLDSGNLEFRKEEFSLEELAADVLERMRVKADQKGVTLVLAESPDLPLVVADPLRMVQVLQNLVDNAVKFNHEGGHVWVSLGRAEDGWVSVEVRDDGDGIPVEDLPHVWERFYTADKSRARKGQGSGLGLAIVHRIVTGHGGQLTLENGVEKGTVFRFTLPCA